MNTKTGLMGLITGFALLLSGCGSDDESTQISLIMSDVNKGVAELTVKVTGAMEAGQTITLSPLMQMNNDMSHGTPLSSYSGELDENGEFTTTAYFLMASNMPDGTSMGDWSITASTSTQEKTFPITVEMMSSDRKNLRGATSGENTDTISGMMADEGRPYYLFEHGRIVNDTENSFEVFIAARETLMDYASISHMDQPILNEGSNYELAVTSVTVEMCTNACEQENNWLIANEDVNRPGVYKATQLGLAGDTSDEINVRLAVNGINKMLGEDDFATFSYSAVDMSSGMGM